MPRVWKTAFKTPGLFYTYLSACLKSHRTFHARLFCSAENHSPLCSTAGPVLHEADAGESITSKYLLPSSPIEEDCHADEFEGQMPALEFQGPPLPANEVERHQVLCGLERNLDDNIQPRESFDDITKLVSGPYPIWRTNSLDCLRNFASCLCLLHEGTWGHHLKGIIQVCVSCSKILNVIGAYLPMQLGGNPSFQHTSVLFAF